jgi:hypothetical protein
LTIGSSKRPQKTTVIRTAQNIYHPYHTGNAIDKYVKNIDAMNKATAYEYYSRLTSFRNFVTNDYKTTVDNLIIRIIEGSEDPYDILSFIY